MPLFTISNMIFELFLQCGNWNIYNYVFLSPVVICVRTPGEYLFVAVSGSICYERGPFLYSRYIIRIRKAKNENIQTITRKTLQIKHKIWQFEAE